MTVVYDNEFNMNEWFVIISLVLLCILVWGVPKILSIMEGMAHFIYGIYIGMFFDHTISIPPWDFYDVNDSSKYELIDFLSYVMFGPYSYFFIYLYVKLGIKGYMNIVYILIWTCLALLMEWIAFKMDVYHYDKGFNMYWSPPIYMFVLSLQVIFYHVIKRKGSV